MPLIIGFALALGVGILIGTVAGFDRDRAFYATVLIIVGSFYCLFAVVGGASLSVLTYEIAFFALFAGLAVFGFKTSMWIVSAGLIAHGLFDIVRSYLGLAIRTV